MPTSHPYQLNEIIELIMLTNPKRILDIGVGFGKYGYLAREYLELWDGRENYDQWTRQIDGIEVFEKYLTPVHKYIYNTIHIGNALEIVPTLKEQYDLILVIDVLEHFDYDPGLQLLKECLERGRNVIISTPKDVAEQGAAFSNPYETHRFEWAKKHFGPLGSRFFVQHDSLIVYLGKDSERIAKIRRRMHPKVWEYLPFLKHVYRLLKKKLSKSGIRCTTL